MDKIENIGYIYKITNLINNKCYIGQTTKSIEERWNRHKRDAFNKEKYNYEYPLYRAFRKYGIENFSFEIIEKCKISELNEKEIYWIKYYNSAGHNGYNQTLGGDGTRILELDEQEVIKKYEEFQVIEKVAKFFNCAPASIGNILKKHNIKIISAQEHAKEKAFIIYMLNENNEILKNFNSIREASRWLVDSGLVKKKKQYPYAAINNALHTGGKCYGYYWYCSEYSQKDKEEYMKKQKQRQKTLNQKKYINSKIPCSICGNLMDSNSKQCLSCQSKQIKEQAIKEKEFKGITREFLKQEIRNKPFTTIAKEQGVSDNAVRKWCKLYNLPSKSSEIKKYSDEEWKNI